MIALKVLTNYHYSPCRKYPGQVVGSDALSQRHCLCWSWKKSVPYHHRLPARWLHWKDSGNSKEFVKAYYEQPYFCKHNKILNMISTVSFIYSLITTSLWCKSYNCELDCLKSDSIIIMYIHWGKVNLYFSIRNKYRPDFKTYRSVGIPGIHLYDGGTRYRVLLDVCGVVGSRHKKWWLCVTHNRYGYLGINLGSQRRISQVKGSDRQLSKI